MITGWIKIHRQLLDKAIWTLSTPEQKTILITLLLMANHEDKDWEWMGERYVCKAGTFITSLEKIAQMSGKGVSIRNVRTALERFEHYGFLTSKSTNKNRLITICNWDSYQQLENTSDKQSDKQLTSNRQATDKQLTTNKNDKNDKNERSKEYVGSIREKRIAFVPPTLQEVKSYVEEKGYWSVDAERFVNFYESKGWYVGKNKMKNWKSAVANWQKIEQNQKHNGNTTNTPYDPYEANREQADKHKLSLAERIQELDAKERHRGVAIGGSKEG